MSLMNSARAVVVVSGDDVYEDLFGASNNLQEILTSVGFAVRIGMGTGRFACADARDDDLVVLYTAVGEFGADSQRGLADAVHAGVGLLAIHSTTVLQDPPGAASELLGGRFLSHGPIPHESRFTAHVDPGHEITAGLGDFDVTHEHYRLAMTGQSRVLVWRDAPYGREPVLYVHDAGKGRVCYLQLGHDMRVWEQPTVRTIIGRAARWARRANDAGSDFSSTPTATDRSGSDATCRS